MTSSQVKCERAVGYYRPHSPVVAQSATTRRPQNDCQARPRTGGRSGRHGWVTDDELRAVNLLDIDEAAARLGCSDTHVYDLMSAGKLRRFNISAFHARPRRASRTPTSTPSSAATARRDCGARAGTDLRPGRRAAQLFPGPRLRPAEEGQEAPRLPHVRVPPGHRDPLHLDRGGRVHRRRRDTPAGSRHTPAKGGSSLPSSITSGTPSGMATSREEKVQE